MPAPEEDYRFQKVQLWRKYPTTDRYGNPIVQAREEITVRWEETNKQVIGPNGQPIALDALVIVRCDVEMGSMMWLGCADDLPTTEIPTSNIMEVVFVSNIPDVKGRHYRKTLGLKRYSNKFPAISGS